MSDFDMDLDAWFESIYNKNFSRLIKTAYYILWNETEAEDIVQNAFSTLLIKQEQLRDHPNISGWLAITVRNKAENEQRRARHTREVPFLPEHEPAASEIQSDFLSLLPPELSEEERQILYLHIEAGLTHEEIAARLGCRPEASRMRLSRARARCKELLLKKNNSS